MSMKSMTTMPPMSRSRSWRTISSAASRLFLVTVCSRLPPDPVNLPVLTSTTVIASVRSITRVPPEGSQTLRSIALASCSSMRCTAKTSGPATPSVDSAGSYLLSFETSAGGNRTDVFVDGGPGVLAGDDQLAEVFVEQVANDLDQDVGLLVERDRGDGRLLIGLGGQRVVPCPALLQPVDVGADVLFLDALGRGPDDHA